MTRTSNINLVRPQRSKASNRGAVFSGNVKKRGQKLKLRDKKRKLEGAARDRIGDHLYSKVRASSIRDAIVLREMRKELLISTLPYYPDPDWGDDDFNPTDQSIEEMEWLWAEDLVDPTCDEGTDEDLTDEAYHGYREPDYWLRNYDDPYRGLAEILDDLGCRASGF